VTKVTTDRQTDNHTHSSNFRRRRNFDKSFGFIELSLTARKNRRVRGKSVDESVVCRFASALIFAAVVVNPILSYCDATE
jgi:hypothetical protein